MYGQNAPTSRLKSRNSFLKTSEKLLETPSQNRKSEWNTQITSMVSKRWIKPSEKLPPEHNIDWKIWRPWNRLGIGLGWSKKKYTKMKIWRLKYNLQIWRIADNVTSTCMSSGNNPIYARWSDNKQKEDSILLGRKYIIDIRYHIMNLWDIYYLLFMLFYFIYLPVYYSRFVVR